MKLDERSITMAKMVDGLSGVIVRRPFDAQREILVKVIDDLTPQLMKIAGVSEWQFQVIIKGKTAALRRAKWRSIRARRFNGR